MLSNGAQSTQRDETKPTDHSFMIPANALHKIRSVTIHYYSDSHIYGFSFFDKNGKWLWDIGVTGEGITVLLAENEVIVGVVAKMHPEYQSVYTDF